MQYLKGLDSYHSHRPSAITLGKFDGLHQGRELLIRCVEKYQRQDDVDGIVFAFDMSPLYEKLNRKTDFLLTNAQKAQLLLGRIDYFVDCPFDERISSMDAETFIKEVLVDRFHAKYVVVGTDFHFGYQKRGDVHMLQEYGKKYNFHVEVIEKKCYEGREISSTYIKELLAEGNKELADRLLGYEYR